TAADRSARARTGPHGSPRIPPAFRNHGARTGPELPRPSGHEIRLAFQAAWDIDAVRRKAASVIPLPRPKQLSLHAHLDRPPETLAVGRKLGGMRGRGVYRPVADAAGMKIRPTGKQDEGRASWPDQDLE